MLYRSKIDAKVNTNTGDRMVRRGRFGGRSNTQVTSNEDSCPISTVGGTTITNNLLQQSSDDLTETRKHCDRAHIEILDEDSLLLNVKACFSENTWDKVEFEEKHFFNMSSVLSWRWSGSSGGSRQAI